MKDLSVIIATFNDSAGAVFTAYQCLLAADGLDTEVLIVDNGSNSEHLDNIAFAIRYDSRISLYRCSLKGAAPSQSMGTKAATGKYIIFPGSHEFYDPHFFPKMIDFMEKDSTIGIACSAYTTAGVESYHGERWGGGDINLSHPFGRNPNNRVNFYDKPRVIAGSEWPPSLMRRDWFLKVSGGFFESVFGECGGALGSERWLSFGTYLFGKKIVLYPELSCYHIIYRANQWNFPGRTVDFKTSNVYAAYVLTGERYFDKLRRDWDIKDKTFKEAKKVCAQAHKYILENQVLSWSDFLNLWRKDNTIFK